MKRTALALLLLTTVLRASFADTIIIRDDHGGSIDAYIKRYNQMTLRGDIPIISGICWSACTYVTRVPRACAEEGAVLAFHRPYVMVGRKRTYTDEVYIQTILLYPERIRAAVNARGGFTENWTYIPARKLLPECKG